MKKQSSTPTPKVAQPHRDTKKDKVIGFLSREGGATLVDVTEATGWLPHTARAMFTGLRKKGFNIVADRSGEATRYRIVGEGMPA